MDSAARSRFPVGVLHDFEDIPENEVIDRLAAMSCFGNIAEDYINALKDLFPVFISRLNDALSSDLETSWASLCEEPFDKLKHYWKPDLLNLGPAERRYCTIMKSQWQSMYYCVYVILLWRHESGHRRYQRATVSLEKFRAFYEADTAFEKRNLVHGRSNDSWEGIFHYRNVLVLVSSIKPLRRNKCLFTKIASILAEGRVHPLGGGQSYAADRRGYLYEMEGQMFTLQTFGGCLGEPEGYSLNEKIFSEPVSVPMQGAELESAVADADALLSLARAASCFPGASLAQDDDDDSDDAVAEAKAHAHPHKKRRKEKKVR